MSSPSGNPATLIDELQFQLAEVANKTRDLNELIKTVQLLNRVSTHHPRPNQSMLTDSEKLLQLQRAIALAENQKLGIEALGRCLDSIGDIERHLVMLRSQAQQILIYSMAQL